MIGNDSHLIRCAIDAALAGARLAENTGIAHIVNHKGSSRDIVTQADLDISALLIEKLGSTGIPVFSEEKPAVEINWAEKFWVVDPIDGTVNFSHGLSHYAVSIGLIEQQKSRLGVVCAPALNELYFTLNSERALLNGRPLVHEHRTPNDALVAMSFSARADLPYYTLFKAVNESTRGCLRTGSAALNICWTASGKLQAAVGFRAKLWDVAGALAIAQAAGCAIALHRDTDPLVLDYCVGSHEVIQHITSLAKIAGVGDTE